jgi:hypothetical protein
VLNTRLNVFQPVFGSAATVTAALNQSIGAVRTTHLCLGVLPGISPAMTRASMELFADAVAPALA